MVRPTAQAGPPGCTPSPDKTSSDTPAGCAPSPPAGCVSVPSPPPGLHSKPRANRMKRTSKYTRNMSKTPRGCTQALKATPANKYARTTTRKRFACEPSSVSAPSATRQCPPRHCSSLRGDPATKAGLPHVADGIDHELIANADAGLARAHVHFAHERVLQRPLHREPVAHHPPLLRSHNDKDLRAMINRAMGHNA